MPTTALISAQDDGALNELEKERVREITRVKAGTNEAGSLDTKLDALTPVMNQLMRAEILEWDGLMASTLKVKGGDDALDLDPERDRAAVTNRVRNRLGYESIADSTKPRMQIVELGTKWRGRTSSEMG